jgi:hypothetical protein
MTDAELDRIKHDGALLRSIVSQRVKLKRDGKGRLKGCCPFHAEKTASFTIFDDGGWKCFGCGRHGSVFDYIMQRDGIDFAAAVRSIEAEGGFSSTPPTGKKSGNSAHHESGGWQPIVPAPADAPLPDLDDCSHFAYRGPDGSLLFYQRRFDKPDGGKTFGQLTYGSLTKNGATITGWHAKGPPQPYPLYRLERLTSADPTTPVLVVEGEGKCEAAERMFPGHVVTAWLNGANSVHLTDWDPLKRFKTVIWWPDADKPKADGRPHGCFLATPAFRKLFPHAKLIDTIGLDDIKDGFDAADLEAQEGVDREAWLKERLREPPPSQRIIPEHEALGIWDAGDEDLANPPPPRGWLLGSIFCRQFISALLADGAVGKTAVRMAQLLSLALGRSLTGEHVFMRCRVLLLSLEDSGEELRRRLFALLLHYKINPADLKGWLFLGAPKNIRLAEMKNGIPTIGPLKEYLENAVNSLKLDIVAIDPFVKSHALAENSNDAMDWVMSICAEMAIKFDIAFDSPHHTNKAVNATPGDANRGRGATAQKDAGRLVYTLTTMSTDEAKQFTIPESERRSYIRMDSAKVNIAPPSTEAKWFKLVDVPLGNTTEQYPRGDHVQASEPWTPPKLWEGLHHPLLNAILDDIEAGMDNGRRYSNAAAVTDRAAWRVVQAHAPDKSEKQCRDVIAAWLRSGTLFTAKYDDPVTRKSVAGLYVNAAQRPS